MSRLGEEEGEGKLDYIRIIGTPLALSFTLSGGQTQMTSLAHVRKGPDVNMGTHMYNVM